MLGVYIPYQRETSTAETRKNEKKAREGVSQRKGRRKSKLRLEWSTCLEIKGTFFSVCAANFVLTAALQSQAVII